MFWRFGGYSNISTLDNILDKPDVTLEDLLDESDLIQELKQQNSKLIEFLRDEAALKKLLDYVVAERETRPETHPATIPEEGEPSLSPSEKSEKRKSKEGDRGNTKITFFGRSRSRSKSVNKSDGETEEEKKEAMRKKYAYISCEVLSSEVWSITEAIFEYRNHLREFWEYLRRPAPLDPVQASYFTKVNDALLDKKTEDMFTFLKSLDGIVPEMLKHVDCPMVMDLLLKMISLEKHEGGQGIVDWLQGQGLIPILLSYLGPENPVATQTSAGDFLKAIITISANATGQDQTVIGPNELTRQLVSEKYIRKLIDDMLHGGNPLTVGVGIVIEVIRKNNSDYDLDNQVGPEPRTTDPIYLGILLREFARRIPDFMTLVRSIGAKRPELKAAFGGTIQPLGFDRFKTCELMAELLHCSNMGLLNERGSEAEMRARDAERERLKAEGKLQPNQVAGSEGEEPFASSVDSYGFHHAQAPDDDFNESPEKINRLEIQNASDEDGFEKVAVPETEALPDEVTFDDLNEKLEEATLPPPPLNLAKDPEKQDAEQGDATAVPKEKRRVSLLTQQIQDHIDETASGTNPVAVDASEAEKVSPAAATNPDDKPPPLFSGRSSPTKGVDPVLGGESPPEGTGVETGTHSIATLQPDAGEQAETRDHYPYEVDLDGQPVAGDHLKMQFVENHVVPTILDFFFRFPWNNFLHNVVYDVVQQVFNGTLERGYNRTVAQDLFATCPCDALISQQNITQRVLDGQAASNRSQSERGMRLGYMGHLTLIAEEICKFAERHPPELLGDEVMERVMNPEWIAYVEGTLSETRDKDNAVLGGVRPEQNMGIRSLSGSGLLGQSGFGGNGNSSALAQAGLGGAPADSLALADAGPGNFETGARAGLLSGFGDGEEDDLEEGEAQERNRAVDDDEQISPPPSLEPPTSESTTLPPPLNVPPSRARRQLAARLAQRRREQQSALSPSVSRSPRLRGRDSSSSSGRSTSSEEEADILAPGTVGESDSEEEEDEEEDRTVHARPRPGSGLRPAGVTAEDADVAGAAGAVRRSGFSDDESTSSSSSGLSDDSHEGGEAGEEEGVGERRRSADAFPDFAAGERQVRRAVSREERRRRRPSTTEAKVRRPIEGSDDEEEEVGVGSSDEEAGKGGLDFEGRHVREQEELDLASAKYAEQGGDVDSEGEDVDSDEDIVEIRPRRTS